MKKGIILPILCVAIISVGLDLAHSETEDKIGAIDGVGRKVEVSKGGVKRLICLGPGSLRLISYLGVVDRVVGVEDLEKRFTGGRPYRLAYPELANLPSIGPGGPESINRKPNMEAILAVSPDIIFVTYMDASLADEVQRLLSIPVFVISYGRFATFDNSIYNSLKSAGKILGMERRAEEIIEFIESVKRDLNGRTIDIPIDKKPRVYVGGIGYRGSHGIESTEQHYLPLEWTNSINLANEIEAKIGSHVFSDKETILKLNPDVIFIDGGGLELVRRDYQKRPDFYKNLKAVQDGAIYVLFPFNFYATNVETVLIDAYVVGKILYPDRFKDIDLESKAKEIYRFFLGKDVYGAMKELYGEPGRKIDFEK
ncbi:MAG: iron ABC transporter substrate-binding protein [Syntrophobacterales bacterium]|nr:iron ABC transporter substrate-binding protein [Syntrophobacterales bacterium]